MTVCMSMWLDVYQCRRVVVWDGVRRYNLGRLTFHMLCKRTVSPHRHGWGISGVAPVSWTVVPFPPEYHPMWILCGLRLLHNEGVLYDNLSRYFVRSPYSDASLRFPHHKSHREAFRRLNTPTFHAGQTLQSVQSRRNWFSNPERRSLEVASPADMQGKEFQWSPGAECCSISADIAHRSCARSPRSLDLRTSLGRCCTPGDACWCFPRQSSSTFQRPFLNEKQKPTFPVINGLAPRIGCVMLKSTLHNHCFYGWGMI